MSEKCRLARAMMLTDAAGRSDMFKIAGVRVIAVRWLMLLHLLLYLGLKLVERPQSQPEGTLFIVLMD